jgi:DUF438 domain-containing protein
MTDEPNSEAPARAPQGSLRAGSLSPETADLIISHLPVGVSFADADGTLVFWEGSFFADCDPSVIGRHLDDCHSPRSRDLISRMQEEFRAGRRDEALFWAREDGRLILSRYVAVRDAVGVYRGILETMQDITDLRTIEGERHDLDW